ncbi:MAG TPA: molybdenum cofactor guanylyltransferase [Terriglobales bacterium]|nr:molybdenum cofactor guanylyltransferase [Terriglobales bacterium]
MPPDDITGFILAGGRSRRMGQDKARIAWGRGTLLTHAIERMQQVVKRVFVVGSAVESPVPAVQDVFSGHGPLAGIHAALAQTTSDWNLVLAVDMPLVTTSLLNLVAAQCDDKSIVVVLRATSASAQDGIAPPATGEAFLQPLCAAYHRRVLPFLEQALSTGELSIHGLLERWQEGIMKGESNALRILGEQELAHTGFSSEMLLNVNTPADLERARVLAGL